MSKPKKCIYRLVKRGLDVFFSLLLLAFLSLPLLIILVAVKINSPGDGIFKQIRLGKDGKPFVCYKFRTMYKNAPPCCPTSKLCNAQKYITPVGRFLRRSSLDELPQLVNVLKGDMSLVGPRPLILSERSVHDSRKDLGVYSIRPGLTGLSQVSGRDNISDEVKVALDAQYLSKLGFIQDIKILALTFARVISGNGAK